jgi:hypothetical protein
MVIYVTSRTDNEHALAGDTPGGTWVNAEMACAFKILTRFRVPGNAGDGKR